MKFIRSNKYIEKNGFTILKSFYLFLIFFYSFTKTVPYADYQLGFQYILGGDVSFIGIILLLSSLRQLHRRNNYKAIMYGISGSIACVFFHGFILNLLENFRAPWSYGYYLGIIGLVAIICINVGILIDYNVSFNVEKEARIKRIILDYSTIFPRLKIREISEISKIDQKHITTTVKKMIQNQEIHAKIYRSSKSILFNQLANLEQIDMLMNLYENWEEQNIGKT